MPMSTGIIFKKPLNQLEAITAAMNVTKPMRQPTASKVSDAPPSNITEFMAVAERPTPITTMMHPVTTGGSTLSIQPVPMALTTPAPTTITKPAAMMPHKAPPTPSVAITTAIGVMKLKDTPK